MKVDWLIVGAGFTGATLAERIATGLNQKVLVVEERNHIGGNAYDYYNEHGILVHKYGSHTFHTNSKVVWDYLSQFTRWRPYFHEVRAVVDGQKIPVPFNLNSLSAVFSSHQAEELERALVRQYGLGKKVSIFSLRKSAEGELVFLADFIYNQIFHRYTLKHWNLKPEELDSSVCARVPVVISRDNRYFQDTYQGIPLPGFTEMFCKMLQHPNIKLLLNTSYGEVAQDIQYQRMIFTGPIDSFFQYKHGPLPYRSMRFHMETFQKEWYQEVGTVNYPNEYDFTRVLEHKHLTGQVSPKTTVTFVYPEHYTPGVNEPYYPIPHKENSLRYALYKQEAEKMRDKVLFAGRLADYQYYNMDQAVARALTLYKQIADGSV